MKLKVSGPQLVDTESQAVDENNTIVTVPQLIKGAHLIKVAYLEVEGDGGMKATAIAFFNANTGEFTIRNTTAKDKVRFDFDLPKTEFDRKRNAAKKSKKSSSPATPATPPAGSQT